jgi:hypothetical protein
MVLEQSRANHSKNGDKAEQSEPKKMVLEQSRANDFKKSADPWLRPREVTCVWRKPGLIAPELNSKNSCIIEKLLHSSNHKSSKF